MGEIADMHIEAYAAGLDPNEMDGADWADFYADDDDLGDPPTGEEIASDFRIITVPDIARAGIDGETFQEIVLRLWPQLSKDQAAQFEGFLEAINGFPEDD